MPTETPLKCSHWRSVLVPDSVLSLICDSVIRNSHGPASRGCQCLLCVLQEPFCMECWKAGVASLRKESFYTLKIYFFNLFLSPFCSAAMQVLQGSHAISSLCLYKWDSQRVCCYCELSWEEKCKSKKVDFADVYLWLLVIFQKRLKNLFWGWIKPAAVVEEVIEAVALGDIPFQGFNPN